MRIRSLLAGVALLALCVTQAQAQQGNLPKPVQALPAYPPIVCVTPKWEREPCENRKEPFKEPFKELGDALNEFFKFLNSNWLGTVLNADTPPPWNGVWPTQKVVLHRGRGGLIGEHAKYFQELAQSGNSVEIRGPCFSACTLIVAYMPTERLCFDEFASLNFHHAGGMKVYFSNAEAVAATRWMFQQYPQNIRDWLNAQGGIGKIPSIGWWTLEAPDLWEMGYRKCEYEAPPPMTTPSKLLTTRPRSQLLQNVDEKEWQAARQRAREWIKGQ
jgi:hypothetical protein